MLIFFGFFLAMYLVAHGILVPLAGIEPGPLAVSAWSPKLLDHRGFFGSSEENKLFGETLASKSHGEDWGQ